jgi:general secretion pathway protein G
MAITESRDTTPILMYDLTRHKPKTYWARPALLALLVAGVAACAKLGNDEGHRYVIVRTQLSALIAACEAFKNDCGRYPATEEGLSVLISGEKTSGWKGPYLTAIPADPWGHPYRYRLKESKPLVISFGPDGVEGTDDDFTSRQLVPR